MFIIGLFIEPTGVTLYNSWPSEKAFYSNIKLMECTERTDNTIYSEAVDDLSFKKWSTPYQIYLLAGIIQHKHPEILWSWYPQIYRIHYNIEWWKMHAVFASKMGYLPDHNHDMSVYMYEREISMKIDANFDLVQHDLEVKRNIEKLVYRRA